VGLLSLGRGRYSGLLAALLTGKLKDASASSNVRKIKELPIKGILRCSAHHDIPNRSDVSQSQIAGTTTGGDPGDPAKCFDSKQVPTRACPCESSAGSKLARLVRFCNHQTGHFIGLVCLGGGQRFITLVPTASRQEIKIRKRIALSSSALVESISRGTR
jgi:hypothetical protein